MYVLFVVNWKQKCIHFHPWFWYCCSYRTVLSTGNYNNEKKKHLPLIWILLFRLNQMTSSKNVPINLQILFKTAFFTQLFIMTRGAVLFSLLLCFIPEDFPSCYSSFSACSLLEDLKKRAHWCTACHLQELRKIDWSIGHVLETWF